MITKPMDVLSLYPVRKNKRQKGAFRDDLGGIIDQSSIDIEENDHKTAPFV